MYNNSEELRRDLQVPIVKEEIQRMFNKYKTATMSHSNALANALHTVRTVRRLKKKSQYQVIRGQL